jgi:WD40 repeat protein
VAGPHRRPGCRRSGRRRPTSRLRPRVGRCDTAFVRGDEVGDATYDAFISYNHAGDRPLAVAIQNGLQQFAKPWYRRRAMRVFRDESSLSATPELWSTIENVLNSSNYFLLVASPESSQSHWVGQEVGYWLQLGRRDRLLLVHSAGQLTWANGDFDWTHTNALPSVLRGAFDQEPLHIDLRWAREQDMVSHRDARLTEPLASLAAPIHGRPRDELIGDDLRQHRRTLRIARSAVATLVVLLLAAVMASVVAVDQRDAAQRQARIAMARLLGIESTSVGPDGADVGLLLAAQAHAVEPDSPSSWGALAAALTRSPALVGYLPESAEATIVQAAPRGDMLAVGNERGAVTLWRAAQRERMRVLASSLPGRVTALAFSDDGGRVIAGDDTGSYAVWEISSGRLVDAGTVPGAVGAVGLDASGVRFAADTDEAVMFGRVGETPRRLPGSEFASSLVFGTDTLTAAGGQGSMVTWQLSTGTLVANKGVGLGQPLASSFTRDLRLFAGVTIDNQPYIVDTATGHDIFIDVGQTGLSIDAMEFDPSGSTLSMLTGAGVVLWDVAANQLKAPVLAGTPGSYQPGSVAVQDGGAVAAAVGDRGVAVWNLNADRLVQRVEPGGIRSLDEVPDVLRDSTSAVFSPNGDMLAWTAIEAGLGSELFVVVWDLESGRERTRLPGERIVSFSPDGNRIATQPFNAEDVVEVTDLDSGRTERHATIPWTGPTTPTADASAQPTEPPWQVHNGRGLGASIPVEGVLALWNTERAQQIGRIDIRIESYAAALAFDPQGRRLAVAISGGLTYVVDVDPNSWRRQACDLAARQLTESERATFLGSVELPDGCPYSN